MPQRGPTRPYTPRQIEIAEGIRLGRSYEQIAAMLINGNTGEPGISPKSVEKAVERMAWLFDCYHEHAFGEDGHRKPREIVLIYAVCAHRDEQALAKLEARARASG